jgi:hypothetical protein
MPRRAQVQVAATHPLFDVVADGTGIVSHAGAALLADGGDCVSDLRALAAQPDLLGTVASVSTAWRVVAEEVATDPRGVPRIWSALARTRTRAWALGAAPTGSLVIDLDATPVKVHSDKQAARPTFKQGFGFHRLLAFLDRGDGTGEALAGVLRPGNAGSNTAADHLAVLGMALAALPRAARDRPVPVRTDAAGATTPSSTSSPGETCNSRSGSTSPSGSARRSWPWVRTSGGQPSTPTTTNAPAHGWASLPPWTLPTGPRHPRDLPPGAPHPGARHKMTFTDRHGHRFQVVITNQIHPDLACLEGRRRAHRSTIPSSPPHAPHLRRS